MILDVIVRLIRCGVIVNKSGKSLGGDGSSAVLGESVLGEMKLGAA